MCRFMEQMYMFVGVCSRNPYGVQVFFFNNWLQSQQIQNVDFLRNLPRFEHSPNLMAVLRNLPDHLAAAFEVFGEGLLSPLLGFLLACGPLNSAAHFQAWLIFSIMPRLSRVSEQDENRPSPGS